MTVCGLQYLNTRLIEVFRATLERTVCMFVMVPSSRASCSMLKF